jgi:hypothetical protein
MPSDPARILDETRFEDVLDLARLPWFEVAGEGALRRLVLADRGIGPAVDVHTHLALSFVRRPAVDLLREWPETEHYLPARGRALDLDVYVNRCFSEGDLARLKRDLTLNGFTGGGMRTTHTIPNLEREMRDLGVSHSVLLPIDFPGPLSRNAETWLAAARGRGAMVAFGSVHPFEPFLARRLDEQVRLGARGVKIHPAVQVVAPDHPLCRRIYRACGERRLPILFHCGPVGIEPLLQRRLTQVRRYEPALAEHPGATFVLGHAGALQPDLAIAFARKYPNVWLEVSSQGLPVIRRILDEVDPSRLLYGTDWPFYHQAIQLAKVLIATEGRDALRRAVLYDNAARLLGLPPRGS